MNDTVQVPCPLCAQAVSGHVPGSLFCLSCEYLFDVDGDGAEVFHDVDVVAPGEGSSGPVIIKNPRTPEEDPSEGGMERYYKGFAFVYYLVFGILVAAVSYRIRSVSRALTFSAVLAGYVFGRTLLAGAVKKGFNLEAEEKTIAKFLDVILVLLILPFLTGQ